MSDIQNYYNKLSEIYDAQRSNPYFRLIEEIEFEALQQTINFDSKKPLRVLEVGCGTGIFLKRLQNSDFLLHGMDYTKGMLEIAQYKLNDPLIQLIQGDAQLLPYASNSFDVVYSFKVLAHVPNLAHALSEIKRVLRPNGVAILEFYNRHSMRYLLHQGGYFHQWHSPTEVAQQLKEAGLTIMSIYGARIVIPFALTMNIPIVREILCDLEKMMSRRAFNRFAGYYMAICAPQSEEKR